MGGEGVGIGQACDRIVAKAPKPSLSTSLGVLDASLTTAFNPRKWLAYPTAVNVV